MQKLFASEAALRHYSELVDMLGASGVLQGDGTPMGGDLKASFRSTVVGTIYGGSSEIQREISSPSCDWVSPRAARPPDQGAQCPVKAGGRFSMKAWAPSRASALPKTALLSSVLAIPDSAP